MGKKGYYLFFGTNSEGVKRKIDQQIAEFNKVMSFEKILVDRPKSTLLDMVLKSIPTVGLGYELDSVLSQLEDPGCIYMRRTTIDKGLIHFLSEVKKKYASCKIIWEIPAYPYFKDSYCNNAKHFLRMFPLFAKDYLYRNRLRKYADYISTFSYDDAIFGIPTLKIRNGIDVSSIAPIHTPLDDKIDLFSVAMMSPHHGYERLLDGLHNYYQNGGNRNIVYHSVGYGSEEKRYRDLVEKYGLQDHVIFYGKKTGKELDAIYENMDIAVASLGLYKKDIKVGSFIKTGEYLAKGLPMITGSPVDVLSHDTFDYFLEFSNDETPIDVERVVEFYDRIYGGADRKVTIDAIRHYAFETVDMSVAMKDVTDVLKLSS